MRCPECHHDSIYIESDSRSRNHIKCNNCEINLKIEDTFIFKLFLFNYDLEKAKALGKMDFLNGSRSIEDNPYSDDNSEVLLQEWWKRGWESEREHMEGTGNIFSAKKEKEELRIEIELLKAELETCYQRMKKKTISIGELDKLRQDMRLDLKSIKTLGWMGALLGMGWRGEIGKLLKQDTEKYDEIAGI